jgi:hypothetical protein
MALHNKTSQKSTSKVLFGTHKLHQQGIMYHAQSSAPEESASGTWFPVEFNEEHVCWVEVRLQEPAGSEAYWQAFRIAGEDLGLDITQGDVEFHIQSTTLTNYRESVASSHSSRASTPSVPSIIQLRPSPFLPGSRDQEIAASLAESLNINAPMSRTLTTEVPAGTINPITGHVNGRRHGAISSNRPQSTRSTEYRRHRQDNSRSIRVDTTTGRRNARTKKVYLWRTASRTIWSTRQRQRPTRRRPTRRRPTRRRTTRWGSANAHSPRPSSRGRKKQQTGGKHTTHIQRGTQSSRRIYHPMATIRRGQYHQRPNEKCIPTSYVVSHLHSRTHR